MAAIVNARDLYLQSSTRKIDISNTLDSTSTLIKMDAQGVVTPSSFTISTLLTDITYPTASFPSNCLREWFYRPNNSTSWYPISTSTTVNFITVTNSTFITHLGTGASGVEYKVILSAPGFTNSVQTILIGYQQEVSNTVMLQLNSYVGLVPATSAGVPDGSFPSASASVYNGNTLLTSGITYNVEGTASSTKNGLTVAINASGTITVSGGSWSTDAEVFNINAIYNTVTYTAKYAVLKAKAGATGNSTYTATVYQQTGSAPAAPTGGSYNFSTATLTAPSGWSVTQPASSTTPTYATDFTFVGAPTATVSGGTWSTPYIEAVNGTNGEYRDIIQLYLQAGSVPTQPTSVTYTFSTNTISGVTGGTAGWSLTQPASSTTPTYITRCLAATTTPTVGVTLTSWSSPVVVAQNGAQGPQGPSGSNGSQGIRGNLTVNLNGGWSDSTANSLIASAASAAGSTPTSPINGDIAYYTGGAKVYNYGWGNVSSFIDGSLVVSGTLGADRIAAGTISANVSLNSGGYIKASGSASTTIPSFGANTFVAAFTTSSSDYGLYAEGNYGGIFGYAKTGGVGVRGYSNPSASGGAGVIGNATAYGVSGLAYSGFGGVGGFFAGQSTDLWLNSAPLSTGTSAAYLSANKPGSTPAYNLWYPINLGGTTYYIAVWQS